MRAALGGVPAVLQTPFATDGTIDRSVMETQFD
jgi:hypothetical protein